MEIKIPFHDSIIPVSLPDGVDILKMIEPEPLKCPRESIQASLASPINSPSLYELADRILSGKQGNPNTARACVVVSDKTRPVPYAGENGILLPILHVLLRAGFLPRNICILIATGTHRAMTMSEMEAMLGKEPFDWGLEVINHDCKDTGDLTDVGCTARGTRVCINTRYAKSDLKILTGLVESHFMAGASGGRKSICPGIFGEEGTFVFHGPALMADPYSKDLVLKGNPVHEESLAVAKLAGVDFIVNVTLNGKFEITGVFSGALEAAHAAAVEKLKSYVGIPVTEQYDIVITHGGFVALNHYQSAKAAVASLGALKLGGGLIMIADNCDPNPIGSDRYRITLALLKMLGAKAYERLLFSDGWTFIPDQWQVQMWGRVFKHIPMNNFIYYAPQLNDLDWRDLPGVDGRKYLQAGCRSAACSNDVEAVIIGALVDLLSRKGWTTADITSGKCRVAFLQDGPYGIPILNK